MSLYLRTATHDTNGSACIVSQSCQLCESLSFYQHPSLIRGEDAGRAEGWCWWRQLWRWQSLMVLGCIWGATGEIRLVIKGQTETTMTEGRAHEADSSPYVCVRHCQALHYQSSGETPVLKRNPCVRCAPAVQGSQSDEPAGTANQRHGPTGCSLQFATNGVHVGWTRLISMLLHLRSAAISSRAGPPEVQKASGYALIRHSTRRHAPACFFSRCFFSDPAAN